MAVNPHEKSSVWYREPLVWMVVAIPLAAVLMGGVTLTLAITTFDGMVSDDYYKQGMQINRLMERDALARRHELSSLVLLGPQGGIVEVHLAGNASFQAPETLNLSLFHATRPGIDHEVVLRRSAAGTYLAARPELAQGRWYLQLDADGWRLKGEFEGTVDARKLQLGRAAGNAQ